MKRLLSFMKEEEGITSIEYALIGTLLALGIVIFLIMIGEKLRWFFEQLGSYF